MAAGFVKDVAAHPLVSEQYRVIATGQALAEDYDGCYPELKAYIPDRPSEVYPHRVEELYEALIKGWDVKIVIIAQKLLWYAEVVASVCKRLGVEVFYAEVFANRVILDRVGAQYTRDCDLRRYVNRVKVLPYTVTEKTRFAQPDLVSPDQLHKKYSVDRGTVCVFGQVPHDNSLVEHRGVGYHHWLDLLFTKNPTVKFAFKHHPLAKTEAAEFYKNVTIIDENIQSCFDAFDRFASFSSTTIVEGVTQGKKFITGGYHFLSESGLVVESVDPVVSELSNHQIDEVVRDRWLSFIYNRYTLSSQQPQLFHRLTMTSDDFFTNLS